MKLRRERERESAQSNAIHWCRFDGRQLHNVQMECKAFNVAFNIVTSLAYAFSHSITNIVHFGIGRERQNVTMY